MDLTQVIELVKELKEIIAALVVAAPLAMQFWQDLKRKGQEAKDRGFMAAAEELYHLGEELKDDWKRAGKGKKDLTSRLRALAPGLLLKYGLGKGFSEEEIQKVLGLGASIHKAKKSARKLAGPGNTVLVLPEEPAPEASPEPESQPEAPEDPPAPSAE